MKSDPYDAPNRLLFVKGLGAIVLLISILSVYFSFSENTSLSSFFHRKHGLIYWMTLVGLFSGSFICFYRAPVLRAFRTKLFLVCLFVQGIFLSLLGVTEILWGLDLFINSFVMGVLVLIGLAYFILLPVLYLKKEEARLWINELALPLPHWLHGIFYFVLFLLALYSGSEQLRLMIYNSVWLYLIVLLVPLNRNVFSRRLIHR